MTALLSLKEVSFAYDNGVALEGINFEVAPGDYLCVLGENGAGKTTLIKGIVGLIKPYSGEIRTGGGLKPSEIGYLPQQTAAQKDFPASVFEVALSGRLNSRGLKPFYSKKDKAAAASALELFGMGSWKKYCYRELSGGQQQRVLLARALCSTKKLLLLDEPAAGLDPVATAELYRAIRNINRKQGVAVIMISHDVKNAVKDASKILHLEHRQLFMGTAKEYATSDLGARFMGGVQ